MPVSVSYLLRHYEWLILSVSPAPFGAAWWPCALGSGISKLYCLHNSDHFQRFGIDQEIIPAALAFLSGKTFRSFIYKSQRIIAIRAPRFSLEFHVF